MQIPSDFLQEFEQQRCNNCPAPVFPVATVWVQRQFSGAPDPSFFPAGPFLYFDQKAYLFGLCKVVRTIASSTTAGSLLPSNYSMHKTCSTFKIKGCIGKLLKHVGSSTVDKKGKCIQAIIKIKGVPVRNNPCTHLQACTCATLPSIFEQCFLAAIKWVIFT
mmetsp:Transcript_10561/g.64927  ORF Transcript_10561/g.64927 Transcript_10561/m.64927 type:complete len:162 (-) Transcript_10561:729-1214(-)